MRTARIVMSVLAATGSVPSMSRAASPAQASRVVDRIAARIEGDIILQSQVRELGAFQQLIEDHAESDDKLLGELIEQWVVQTEAAAAHFPEPAQSEVDRELARLQGHLEGPGHYAARLNELNLSPGQVREMLSRQIYVERYLDYKFRPTVQIDPKEIDSYYQHELLPELARKNQQAPSRTAVAEQIREVLIQKRISEATVKWLDETKSRLKIEIEAPGGRS